MLIYSHLFKSLDGGLRDYYRTQQMLGSEKRISHGNSIVY